MTGRSFMFKIKHHLWSYSFNILTLSLPYRLKYFPFSNFKFPFHSKLVRQYGEFRPFFFEMQSYLIQLDFAEVSVSARKEHIFLLPTVKTKSGQKSFI